MTDDQSSVPKGSPIRAVPEASGGAAAPEPAASTTPPRASVTGLRRGRGRNGAPRTRVSAAFVAAVTGFLVLLLLLIFILQNTETVTINFLGAKGHLGLGVGLLLAAVGGALIVAILGGARIAQLRRARKR